MVGTRCYKEKERRQKIAILRADELISIVLVGKEGCNLRTGKTVTALLYAWLITPSFLFFLKYTDMLEQCRLTVYDVAVFVSKHVPTLGPPPVVSRRPKNHTTWRTFARYCHHRIKP